VTSRARSDRLREVNGIEQVTNVCRTTIVQTDTQPHRLPATIPPANWAPSSGTLPPPRLLRRHPSSGLLIMSLDPIRMRSFQSGGFSQPTTRT
jgi:hypothetical protein